MLTHTAVLSTVTASITTANGVDREKMLLCQNTFVFKWPEQLCHWSASPVAFVLLNSLINVPNVHSHDAV